MTERNQPSPRPDGLRSASRRPAHRAGSAAVEFALWLPVMLMFVASVVDYGFYMTRRVTVARAAMEGARMGAAVFEADNVAPGSMIVPIAESRAGEVLTPGLRSWIIS